MRIMINFFWCSYSAPYHSKHVHYDQLWSGKRLLWRRRSPYEGHNCVDGEWRLGWGEGHTCSPDICAVRARRRARQWDPRPIPLQSLSTLRLKPKIGRSGFNLHLFTWQTVRSQKPVCSHSYGKVKKTAYKNYALHWLPSTSTIAGVKKLVERLTEDGEAEVFKLNDFSGRCGVFMPPE